MGIQLLVSAVDKDAAALVRQMHIATEAVIVNQCGRYGYEEITVGGHRVQVFSMPERGVGLSRNTALLHAAGISVSFRTRILCWTGIMRVKSSKLMRNCRRRI